MSQTCTKTQRTEEQHTKILTIIITASTLPCYVGF